MPAGLATPINLGSFSGGVSPWSVDVNWGDSSADTVFADSTSGAIPAQSHTFTGGVFDVTVTVTDSTSLSGSASFATIVTPVVTPSTTPLALNPASIVINGRRLRSESEPRQRRIQRRSERQRHVGQAATALTVTFTTEPTTAGSLTAVVAADNISSGAPVQVATVGPSVTASNANLAANATQITISGSNFDPTAANDTVAFNDGAVGSVTVATATSLTVTFSTKPTTAGSLTAVVTTDGVGSGAAVRRGHRDARCHVSPRQPRRGGDATHY